MKKEHNIKLSFNTNTLTHSLKHIVGYYYKEYVELNDKFENISEDEYAKIMITKGENAKTEKQRAKIAEEYAENIRKYYSSNSSYSILSYNNQVNKLNGYIAFKYDEIEEQLNLPLLDFISYDLNNINEYIIFFINYFELVMDILDKDVLDMIKLNTLYEIKFISDIAKNYYDKVVKEAKKMQTIFKMCIDLVYQMNNNEYTLALTKDLTKEQRFFVFNQVNNHPFKNISSDFKTVNILDYTYEYVDSKVPEVIISILKAMDPKGKEITQKYQYETENLYTAFYIMLYDIIGINNAYVKICGNCGRYFMTAKSNISYCDRIYEEDMTCREYVNLNYQRIKLEMDEVYGKYRLLSARFATRCQPRRKDQTEVDPKYIKDWEEFKTVGKKLYKESKKDITSAKKFAEWVNKMEKK